MSRNQPDWLRKAITRNFGRVAARFAEKLIKSEKGLAKPLVSELSKYDMTDYMAALSPKITFKVGEKVSVRIKRFTPLGAVVDIYPLLDDSAKVGDIKIGDVILPPDEDVPKGLIYADELNLATERLSRNIEVGERLEGYIGQISDDNKINVLLRPIGISRIKEVKEQILKRLESSKDNSIPVGDRSPTESIAEYFPGVTKRDFKIALGALYKEMLVIPSSDKIVKATSKQQAEMLDYRSKNEAKPKASPDVLFLGNLPEEVSKEELAEHLSLCIARQLARGQEDLEPLFELSDVHVGTIRLIKKEDGALKGFGYVDIKLNLKLTAKRDEVLKLIVLGITSVKFKSKKIRCDVSTSRSKSIPPSDKAGHAEPDVASRAAGR